MRRSWNPFIFCSRHTYLFISCPHKQNSPDEYIAPPSPQPCKQTAIQPGKEMLYSGWIWVGRLHRTPWRGGTEEVNFSNLENENKFVVSKFSIEQVLFSYIIWCFLSRLKHSVTPFPSRIITLFHWIFVLPEKDPSRNSIAFILNIPCNTNTVYARMRITEPIRSVYMPTIAFRQMESENRGKMCIKGGNYFHSDFKILIYYCNFNLLLPRPHKHPRHPTLWPCLICLCLVTLCTRRNKFWWISDGSEDSGWYGAQVIDVFFPLQFLFHCGFSNFSFTSAEHENLIILSNLKHEWYMHGKHMRTVGSDRPLTISECPSKS